MINVEDWENHNLVELDYNLPPNVDKIGISYDRGRLYVYINEEEVYVNLGGMCDFSVTLDNIDVTEGY